MFVVKVFGDYVLTVDVQDSVVRFLVEDGGFVPYVGNRLPAKCVAASVGRLGCCVVKTILKLVALTITASSTHACSRVRGLAICAEYGIQFSMLPSFIDWP